jgi:hypothetical protein
LFEISSADAANCAKVVTMNPDAATGSAYPESLPHPQPATTIASCVRPATERNFISPSFDLKRVSAE